MMQEPARWIAPSHRKKSEESKRDSIEGGDHVTMTGHVRSGMGH
jgi:hypothetical protein